MVNSVLAFGAGSAAHREYCRFFVVVNPCNAINARLSSLGSIRCLSSLPMVYVMGFGQMCNNLLQFGHFYAWGRENGVQVIGMRFCYKYLDFQLSNEKGHSFFTYVMVKYAAKLKLIPTLHFDEEEVLTAESLRRIKEHKHVVVKGWFMRDYELFLKYRPALLRLFAFRPAVVHHVKSYLQQLPLGKLRIGLHIRRGDYARWYNGKYCFSDDDYIKVVRSALPSLGQDSCQLFIATNDPKVDAAYYAKQLGIAVYKMGGSPTEDLCLLSQCHYLLGPPSTFSLMAAFYGDLPLYWIEDIGHKVELASFGQFEQLFRRIL